MSKRITKSKRFWVTMGALFCNFVVFTIGIYQGADLTALGAGLALLNAPLYGYVWSETQRPSGLKHNKHDIIEKAE